MVKRAQDRRPPLPHKANKIPQELRVGPENLPWVRLEDEHGVIVMDMPLRVTRGGSYDAEVDLVRSEGAMRKIGELIAERYTASAGNIYGPEVLMITQHVGGAECADPALGKFELLMSSSASPMIRCERTGKTYSLKWEAILRLAIAAGVADD